MTCKLKGENIGLIFFGIMYRYEFSNFISVEEGFTTKETRKKQGPKSN